MKIIKKLYVLDRSKNPEVKCKYNMVFDTEYQYKEYIKKYPEQSKYPLKIVDLS